MSKNPTAKTTTLRCKNCKERVRILLVKEDKPTMRPKAVHWRSNKEGPFLNANYIARTKKTELMNDLAAECKAGEAD